MTTVADLRPADILLSTGNAKVSGAIRFGTGSRYSHASLYVGEGEIIEAISIGVVRQSLEAAMSDDTLVVAYRRTGLSDAQAGQVIRYAASKVGKPYDEPGAVGAGVTSGRGFVLSVFAAALIPGVGSAAVAAGLTADVMNRLNPERTFFCSELVALAFAAAGAPLGSGAASTTPGDIASAHVLNAIGTLKG